MRAPQKAVIPHKKIDEKLLEKQKAERKASKKNNGRKDSNAPKRPATAFLIFMKEFRTTFKGNYPEAKSVSAVGKAGGEKWKSMSDAVNLLLLALLGIYIFEVRKPELYVKDH